MSLIISPFIIHSFLFLMMKPGHFLDGLTVWAIALLIILPACSATVYLEDNLLIYCTCFFIRRSVNLDSVTKVKVTAQPAPTLVLTRFDHPRPFKFIIKPFSKNSVTFIMHYIREHAPHAKFSSISSDLERGDFASVTRETIQFHNLLRIGCVVACGAFLSEFSQAKTHSMLLTAGIIVVAVLVLITMALKKKRSH
jgi:hypothetical protein